MVDLEKYINNLHLYYEIENKPFEKNQSYSLQMEARSKDKKIIKDENDLIIKEIKKLNNTRLSEEERINLSTNVVKLFDGANQFDTMIAYIIYQILLHDAKVRADLEFEIEYNYYCGLCYFYLTRNFTDIVENIYFNNSERYIPYLNKVNTVSKRHIISCYGNRMMPFINKDYKKALALGKESLNFIDKIENKYKDEINFDIYKLGLYRNIATCIIGYESNQINKEEFRFVYDCIEQSLQMSKLANQTNASRLTNYYYSHYLAKYLNEEIDINEFIANIIPLCVPDDTLTDAENYLRVFDMSAKYLHFLKKSNISNEEYNKILNEKLEYILAYAHSIKKSELSYYLDDKIINFLVPLGGLVDYQKSRKIIYDITVCRHEPTYIHSKMVVSIASALAKYAVEDFLDQFVGVNNYKLEELELHKQEIIELIKEAAAFHDIGKWVCIDVISNSSRNLEDLEFSLIKEHPYFGYELIKDSNFPEAIKEAILYHQRSYDKKSGYPNRQDIIKNQGIVDLITICDCIDAGTDFVGRPYSKRKSLEDIKNELLAGINTKYSPMVKLLNRKDVFDEINYLVTKGRIELNDITIKELEN